MTVDYIGICKKCDFCWKFSYCLQKRKWENRELLGMKRWKRKNILSWFRKEIRRISHSKLDFMQKSIADIQMFITPFVAWRDCLIKGELYGTMKAQKRYTPINVKGKFFLGINKWQGDRYWIFIRLLLLITVVGQSGKLLHLSN